MLSVKLVQGKFVRGNPNIKCGGTQVFENVPTSCQRAEATLCLPGNVVYHPMAILCNFIREHVDT